MDSGSETSMATKRGFLLHGRGWLSFGLALALLGGCAQEGEQRVGNLTFTIPPELEYHPGNQLKRGKLAMDQAVNDVTYLGGSVMSFYENGQIADGMLSGDAEVQGVPLKGQPDAVSFHENGRIRKATLSKDFTIGTIAFKPNTVIFVRAEGSLSQAYTYEPHEIQGLSVRGSLMFREDGSLSQAQLAETVTQNRDTYEAGSIVRIAENGLIGGTEFRDELPLFEDANPFPY